MYEFAMYEMNYVAVLLPLFFMTYTTLKLLSTRRSMKKMASELELYKPIKDTLKVMIKLEEEMTELELSIDEAHERLKNYELKTDVIEMGFYQPKFTFDNSLDYIEALELVREAQQELIRQKTVLVNSDKIMINRKFKDLAKLAVSAFNGECSVIIDSVKYDNFETCKKTLQSTFEKINTLISETELSISEQYLDLKIKELALVYDYKEVMQKTKDEQNELKAIMQEEETARNEAEAARDKAIQEQKKYEFLLERANQEMTLKADHEKPQFKTQILEIQRRISVAISERDKANAMAQLSKRGHVYVLSNIGSFGENVLKIGMTQRKDPHERVRELAGDALPFNYDIHAMIETEDAPALQQKLHKYFNDQRKNRINNNKDFFNINIEDLAFACEELGLDIKLTKIAEAKEYRESMAVERSTARSNTSKPTKKSA